LPQEDCLIDSWKSPEFLILFALSFQTVKTSMFERRKVDPQNVAAIILGGGNGAKLFPLTMRAATPAVNIHLTSFSLTE